MNNRELICLLSPEQNENIDRYFADLYGKDYEICPLTGGRFESALEIMRESDEDQKIKVLDKTTGKVQVTSPYGKKKEAFIVCVLTREGQSVDGTVIRE